jgi:hypothetical protein
VDDLIHVIVKALVLAWYVVTILFSDLLLSPLEVIQTVAALALLSFNYFIHGDKPNRLFTVKVPKTDNVSILKNLIGDKNAPIFDLDFEIWKVDTSWMILREIIDV